MRYSRACGNLLDHVGAAGSCTAPRQDPGGEIACQLSQVNPSEVGFSLRICLLGGDGRSTLEVSAGPNRWKDRGNGCARDRLSIPVYDPHTNVGSSTVGRVYRRILSTKDIDSQCILGARVTDAEAEYQYRAS